MRVKQDTIKDSLRDFGNIARFPKTQQNAANHETDFELPLYNIWTQQEIANAVGMDFNSRAFKDAFVQFGNIADLHKTKQNAANHETDSPNWTPPRYGD